MIEGGSCRVLASQSAPIFACPIGGAAEAGLAAHQPEAAWHGGGGPGQEYSPEQIAGRLKVEFPDQPEMQVSTETIYQSLYVQSRGAETSDQVLEDRPACGGRRGRSGNARTGSRT